MNLYQLARRAVQQWQNWRARNALRKAIPELAELDRKHKECVRRHSKGSAAVLRRKREIMNAALAMNIAEKREWI